MGITATTGTTGASTGRFHLGNGTGDGALANAGVGFTLNGLNLFGVCHNGGSLVTSTINTVVALGTAYNVGIVSNGLGTVTWHVNGTQKASSTLGPTAAGLVGSSLFVVNLENGTVGSLISQRYHFLKIYVAQ